jgi:hypothetical protein
MTSQAPDLHPFTGASSIEQSLDSTLSRDVPFAGFPPSYRKGESAETLSCICRTGFMPLFGRNDRTYYFSAQRLQGTMCIPLPIFQPQIILISLLLM